MAHKIFGGMAVGIVLVAGMAMSQAFAHDHEKMNGMMDRMDTNHDGMVSAAEHAAYAKSMFDKMDANHDGMVSKVEMDAGMKMMHEDHERDEHMMKDGKEESSDKTKDEMDEKKEK